MAYKSSFESASGPKLDDKEIFFSDSLLYYCHSLSTFYYTKDVFSAVILASFDLSHVACEAMISCQKRKHSSR